MQIQPFIATYLFCRQNKYRIKNLSGAQFCLDLTNRGVFKMKSHASLIEKCDGVPDTAPISKCIKIMIDKNVDLLPVVDNSNRLVGVITEIDFAKIVKVSPSGWAQEIIGSEVAKGFIDEPISSIMTKETIYVRSDEDFQSVMQKMLSKHTYKRLPVVDHDMKLIGIVRLIDVINKILE